MLKQEDQIQNEPPALEPTLNIKRRIRPGESVIHGLLFLCAAISILTTIGLVIELGKESFLFFKNNVNLIKFFTSTKWQPAVGEYGVLPLITATLTTTFFALLISLPLGLSAAIYLSEYASLRTRQIFKPVLEILAGIPSVVYGYFALTTVTPLLRLIFGSNRVEVYNMLSAGLVMGIMILPTVCTMSEDALSAVPRSLRDAAYSLGATKFETSLRVVMPAAISGIIASFFLGLSRAVGETMIVAIAAGQGPNFTINPLRSAETMTGYIARISGGDVAYNTPDYNSIFALGLLLFLITMTLNLVGRRFTRKLREVYE